MPVFTYLGNNAAGEKVEGERAAENKQVLRAALARERVQANVIKEKGAGFNLNMKIGRSVKAKEQAIFFRQFSVMIDAGLPLVQCLEILGNNQQNDFFKDGSARRPHLGPKAALPWRTPCAPIPRSSTTSPPTWSRRERPAVFSTPFWRVFRSTSKRPSR